MKYIVLILVFSIYSCSNTDKGEYKHEHLRHVGDIDFNNKIDDPGFQPCHEDLATVYYARFDNAHLYKGEKPAIEKALEKIDLPKIAGSSGYIIVRFMVNCKGETGRFRVEQLDFEYKEKNLTKTTVEAILSTTKSLDGWISAYFGDDKKTYDYYKHLTFKIIDNQITDILP